jgi:cytidyltransferase-like protein
MNNEQHIIESSKGKKLVMVSGGFDPVHVGHLRMFEEAKKLGDELLVVLNCDAWLIRKKGKAFMSQAERAELIRGFRAVDYVYVLESDRADVCEAILRFKPAVFANGGDRKSDNIPEYQLCDQLGIGMVFDVGHGGKVQSSSWLLSNYGMTDDSASASK